MAVSLKAMWNLMNVMQVFAYLKFASNTPANLQLILKAIHDAVNLLNFKSRAVEISQEAVVQNLNSEKLQEAGIEHIGLFWSLGIYALICIILVGLLILYYLISYLMERFRWLKIVERYLRRKLFYSSAIRFMIESNLKITHNSIFYLLMLGSFSSFK